MSVGSLFPGPAVPGWCGSSGKQLDLFAGVVDVLAVMGSGNEDALTATEIAYGESLAKIPTAILDLNTRPFQVMCRK